MGKIFGISDLPVSTIMTPFEPVVEFKNHKIEAEKPSKIESSRDVFLPEIRVVKSNPFIRMRNGFGKLMKHFSKKI
jgi:hypothetical protein